ncbi:MAG: copper chaperone PCu(A)C [Gammaproteobacteria bacterium]|nr:copper chaperone PCu(A)C [Gammaproteobacteria bacterium]
MKHLTLILLLMAAALPARAERFIDVHDAWIRHIPGDRPMAGYFVLENRGDADRRLVGASSAGFGAIHLHETVDNNGTSSMRPLESAMVPAGGRALFEPGARHLMLMQRRDALEVGDEVVISLEFADGGSQSAVFTIKPVWQE